MTWSTSRPFPTTSCRPALIGNGRATGNISTPSTGVDWALMSRRWWRLPPYGITSWGKPPSSARPLQGKLPACASCCVRPCTLAPLASAPPRRAITRVTAARPLACRNASQEELAGLCHALRDVGRGTIEIALSSGGMNLIDDADLDLLRLLTRESGRPVTWLALFARPGEPDFHHTQTVTKLGDLLGQAIPQITPRPIMTQGDLRNPSIFASFLTWQPAFNRPLAEQIALYQQSEFREAFRQELYSRKRDHIWGQTRVLEVHNPALASYCGKTIQEVADLQGKQPIEAYLDLAIADDLLTRYQGALFNYDQAGVERLVTDDRFLIGLSDGGAHVDFLCDAGYATALLDIWVRQHEALTLEKAVHKLTAVPAALFGIPNRGILAAGKIADLVLFDPTTVAAQAPEYAYDFPHQGRRLIARSEGVMATFVAGTQVYDHSTHTGALPGRILRSYE